MLGKDSCKFFHRIKLSTIENFLIQSCSHWNWRRRKNSLHWNQRIQTKTKIDCEITVGWYEMKALKTKICARFQIHIWVAQVVLVPFVLSENWSVWRVHPNLLPATASQQSLRRRKSLGRSAFWMTILEDANKKGALSAQQLAEQDEMKIFIFWEVCHFLLLLLEKAFVAQVRNTLFRCCVTCLYPH